MMTIEENMQIEIYIDILLVLDYTLALKQCAYDLKSFSIEYINANLPKEWWKGKTDIKCILTFLFIIYYIISYYYFYIND